MKRSATRRAMARSCAALLLALIAVPAAAGAAPTPEEVRACVEGNLARYSDPSTAVAAQYADAEATCIAALEGGGVTVEFEPGATSDGDETTGGGGGSAGGSDGGSAAPESSPPDAVSGAGSATGTGANASAEASSPTAAEAAGAADLVAEAIADADAGAGSPLPSSVTDGPGWMLALLGGAALLVGGAAVLAVRRRLN